MSNTKCPCNKYKKLVKKENASSLLYSVKEYYNNTFTPNYLLKNSGRPLGKLNGPNNIFIFRHGEKTNSGIPTQKSYAMDCNGFYRASKFVDFVNNLGLKGTPIDYIITCNPNPYQCQDPTMRNEQFVSIASYMLNIPMFIFSFENEIEKTVKTLFDYSPFNDTNVMICWGHKYIQNLLKNIIDEGIIKGRVEEKTKEEWIIKNTPVKPENVIDSLWPYWDSDNFNMVYHLNPSYSFNYFIEPIKTCHPNVDLILGKNQDGVPCKL